MQINLPNDVHVIQFPDGTPHVRLRDVPSVPGFIADVRTRLRTPKDLWILLSTVDAIKTHFGNVGLLDIPYLMGARYDRCMERGDAVDLRVVAQLINSCGFKKVRILDPHSDMYQFINNAEAVDNEFLVRAYKEYDAVLVVPDAGAAKKAKKYREWARITDEVYCSKVRDSSGKVTLKVHEPERCTGRDVVIIDDICDGGATFVAIHEQIKPAHSTLIVTHGIFSKGFAALDRFDHIITSDSFVVPSLYSASNLTIIPSVI